MKWGEVYWHIYESPGLNEFTHCGLKMPNDGIGSGNDLPVVNWTVDDSLSTEPLHVSGANFSGISGSRNERKCKYIDHMFTFHTFQNNFIIRIKIPYFWSQSLHCPLNAFSLLSSAIRQPPSSRLVVHHQIFFCLLTGNQNAYNNCRLLCHLSWVSSNQGAWRWPSHHCGHYGDFSPLQMERVN